MKVIVVQDKEDRVSGVVAIAKYIKRYPFEVEVCLVTEDRHAWEWAVELKFTKVYQKTCITKETVDNIK